MIHGIGTDIVRIARMASVLDRYGERFAHRILAPGERAEFAAHNAPERFLAKRFAAKEAFGKAFGTGVVAPATLHALIIDHDCRGKPFFRYGAELADEMAQRRLVAQLSLSDETDYVVAFVVIEQQD